MSNHTPGPWVTFRLDGEFSIIPAGRPGDIAIIEYDHPEGCEQASADAYLIAAAPDMLALLKLALGDAEHVLSQKFWDDVRAVVGKAEGSPPPPHKGEPT